MLVSSLRASLLVLASANDDVTLGPTGVAATVSEACRAYQALQQARDQLAAVEPELVQLVRVGSPAATVYAALLLKSLGRHDLRELLAPYADDRRPCAVWPGGCSGISLWLCEATRWVLGEAWSHPERLLANELEHLTRATWFELPTEVVLVAARERRRSKSKAARGRWTFTFAELYFQLVGGSPALQKLVAPLVSDPDPTVRLYGALLLGQLDRPAGEAALRHLAASGDVVPYLSRGWFGRTSVRPRGMQEVVARATALLSPYRAGGS